METIIGLKGPTFAMLACDRYSTSSIIRMQDTSDKILLVDDNKLLGLSGEIGDRLQFGEYIQKNMHLYQFRNNKKLSCPAAASYARQQLAYYLRRSPYHVNIMLAGYDEVTFSSKAKWKNQNMGDWGVGQTVDEPFHDCDALHHPQSLRFRRKQPTDTYTETHNMRRYIGICAQKTIRCCRRTLDMRKDTVAST
ncbi:UNVERIFIED_CONTAM: hypothetical protein H355_007987, partial [Colinus virginianus]